MTSLPSFCKFKILKTLVKDTLLKRNISHKENAKVKKRTSPWSKATYWISPNLSNSSLKEIKSVTSISIGFNYISWAKLLLPKLDLFKWDIKVLPKDFLTQKDESSILNLAYEIHNILPKSDLYVMESSSTRESSLHFGINKLQLSSMLAVLLNGVKEGPVSKEKVIFQKKFVMNYLYDIMVASERVSTRLIVENILLNSAYLADRDANNTSNSIFPVIKTDYKCIENFKQYDLEKQENLSLALLLALSFINVNIFKNTSSLWKIQKRKKDN